MGSSLETKACINYAKAKRKCGRQVPRCLRCRKRGIIKCEYPASKPTSWVLRRDDEHAASTPSSSYIAIPGSWAGSSRIVFDPVSQLSRNPKPVSQSFDAVFHHKAASSWFASINTWEVVYPRYFDRNSISAEQLKRCVRKLRPWFVEWTEKSSNPFIHAQLYHNRFPRAIQDAYMALSCYVNKTEANEQTVFRLVEGRVKELLENHGVSPTGTFINHGRPNPTPLDSLEHIARVQALLVYQFIGLYDGDIRLRHLAERNIPVLNRWVHQMVQHASQAACLGGAVVSPLHEESVVLTLSISDTAPGDNLLWYSWILAESIRRMWVIVLGMQGLYLMLQQQDVAAPCLGGIMFTTRRGVWDAPTAQAWEKMCSEVNVGLLQTADTDKLFVEAAPDDVDTFAKFVLEVVFGVERTERWTSFMGKHLMQISR